MSIWKLSLVVSSLIFSASVKAALVWNWSLDTQSFVVGPTDVVTVTGTIYNDHASTVTLQSLDEFIDNSSSGGLSTPKIDVIFESTEISTAYYADSGPLGVETLQSQFQGVTIAPGSSYSFELFTLIPGIGPTLFDPSPLLTPAEIGTYTSSSVGLSIDGFGEGSGSGFYSGGSLDITVVPIPSSLLLLASGLLAILYNPSWRVLTMSSSRRR